MSNRFTEEDKKKVIEFLNLVAKYAKFNMDTTEIIAYFHSLSYMQRTILPKIEANTLEVVRVVSTEENKD